MSEFEEKDYNESFNLDIWKKIFKYLLPHKKLVLLGFIIAVVIAILDTVLPMMNKWAIDGFIKEMSLDGIGWFFAIYITLVLLLAIMIYAFIRVAGRIQVALAYDIRKKTFNRLQELSFSYFDTTNVGWLMARVTSDSNRLSHTLSWGFIDLVWGTLVMIAIAIAMLIFNYKLALIVLSVVPLLVVSSIYFRKKILYAYRKVRKINSRITGGFNEGIMGAMTTKTLVLEEKNLEDFDKLTTSMKKYSVRSGTYSAMFFPIVLVIGYLGTSMALYFGGYYIQEDYITYGTLVLFVSYTTFFFDPVLQLARIIAEFQQAQASAERIFSLIETEPEIKDSMDVIKKYGTMHNPKVENYEYITGDIEFNNVTFKYKTGETVLENFNLKVKAGTSVALVGETGAGKSTIVNLICRFYEPTSGEILIDGKDYRERSVDWLHSNLGYVLQSPHLFSGSIKQNIQYGKLDATFEEVERVTKLVNADEFINKFDKGYDTEVGEGGSKLSVGEKQLVSFARAIIADPSIFILDEATSSIDTETEKIIQDAIERILENRTSFIIAHRLSTIVNSDIILVLKEGKVIEQGNHQELLNLNGYYKQLYTNQFHEKKENLLLDK